jgi:hypothetical protein
MGGSGATPGGQGISVVKYSDQQALALDYLKGFAQPAVQQTWWDAGGFSCHTAVLGKPGFDKSSSYAPVFLDSMKIVKDFWQEPSYAQPLLAMQKRTHDYVVAGKGTPQAALDGLLKDWTEVFKEDGTISATWWPARAACISPSALLQEALEGLAGAHQGLLEVVFDPPSCAAPDRPPTRWR